MERAMEIAREICQRSPEAIRHIKALTGERTKTGRARPASAPNSRDSRTISAVSISQRALLRFGASKIRASRI